MKLNTKRTILIGLAFMSISTFWQFYDNEIPKILKNTFGLGESWTGVIMALDNVLALFLLPFFGNLSDKTDSKIGKRMPYILGGTAAAVTLLIVLTSLAHQSTMLIPFIIVLLMLLVSMGTYRSPAVSLMPELTPAPVRSKANAIINLMGTVGAVYTLLMIKLLLKRDASGNTNYWPLVISICVFMVAAVIILFLTVPEKKLAAEITDPVEEETEQGEGGELSKDVKKSMIFLLLSVFLWFTAYNAVTTAFSRYVEVVWDLHNGEYANCLMVATISAVICYIPIGNLSQKIGRKKMILTGIVAMSVCYLCGAFVKEYAIWVNILFAVIGFGWAAINVNSYPMVVEMARSGEIGKYTGTYYTFSMAAQVFTPILSGILLEYVSYGTLFPYAFFFSCLAFVTMSQVQHGDIDVKKETK